MTADRPLSNSRRPVGNVVGVEMPRSIRLPKVLAVSASLAARIVSALPAERL